ncbi:MAG: hypothetical protein SFX18_07230 [Pirellulales bacterium]|nr:hypothetical protein [Pirellulales bacterium]
MPPSPAQRPSPAPQRAAPASAPAPASSIPPGTPTADLSRLASLDAYRGLVMFLMMAEVLHLCGVAQAFPESAFWSFLCWHQSHVEWIGCSLHDLIQPSFSFLVGVALPYSLASRAARGDSFRSMTLHALLRSVILILLGVWLRSIGRDQTYWTFEDTLSQIGLGYFWLYLLGWRAPIWQWLAFVALVVGYWGAFALHPVPTNFDYAAVGVSPEWLAQHGHTGFMEHWQKNSNLAWAFDTWWMNLFPREQPFTHNGGGYATLSFIPTLATMVLGLIAGGILRRGGSAGIKVLTLVILGLTGLLAGWLSQEFGYCPIVKRIWTPAWVLFSGGWCFILLAAFYAVLDWAGWRAWAFPLRVIGQNSIAAYCIAHLFDHFIHRDLDTHLGKGFFTFAGAEYEQLLQGATVLLIFWLILFWLHRQKIYIKI